MLDVENGSGNNGVSDRIKDTHLDNNRLWSEWQKSLFILDFG
jgi:hypothetical protein